MDKQKLTLEVRLGRAVYTYNSSTGDMEYSNCSRVQGQDWRNGSEIKSTYCPYIEPVLPAPTWRLRTTVPRDPMASSGLLGHQTYVTSYLITI